MSNIEKIRGKEKANQTHFEVGQKVRKTIKELGGEIPGNYSRHCEEGKARRSNLIP